MYPAVTPQRSRARSSGLRLNNQREALKESVEKMPEAYRAIEEQAKQITG
jgi:hypothetical protein